MSSLVYGILWVLVRILSRIFLRYRSIGTENTPPKGGILLAANHASYADIPLLGCGVRRRLYYLGRSSLFPNPLVNWITRWLGWIPLKTDRLDRKAFQQASYLLKEGKPVVIFPEGTRTPDGKLQPGRPGIGILVAETGCSVVPVHIGGTFKVLPMGSTRIRLHPVSVTFGEPINFQRNSTVSKDKEFYYHVSQTVMQRIAELGHVEQPADPLSSTQATPPPTYSGPVGTP